jgi:hypothetical protein
VVTGSPYQVEEGRSITLDASKSADLDKLTFAWDLGDGQTETGESISYTPPNVGENVVTVAVSDGVDEVEQDVVVEVTNVAPVVDAGGPYTGQVGADIVIDGASAQDPSDPTGETFTYTWDLDADGTFEKTGQQVDFAPEESGKFEIALTATMAAAIASPPSASCTFKAISNLPDSSGAKSTCCPVFSKVPSASKSQV